MKTFIVHGIKYDTDGKNVELPDRLEIDLPDDIKDNEITDRLSDEISNITGFCHFGFLITS